MEKQIDYAELRRFQEAFEADPKNKLALNAVTKNDIATVALDRGIITRFQHVYSHMIETPEATDQKRSGRCWLFAGLNTLRLAAMEKMNLDKFELSQSYLMFWDKLEKVNYFLESIIETRDVALDEKLLLWLLGDPIPDGGQWDMFVNLVKKYGVVPKSVMPETYSSSNTGSINAPLIAKLREDAQILREMHTQGATVEALRQTKEEMIAAFYTMLCIHLGQPPDSFFWEWRDKEKQFHRAGEITPKTFFNQYVAFDLDEIVCLIHAPTPNKPYHKLYTVQYLGNVVEGQQVRYLNAEIGTLKKAAVDMITDGQAVWFGCDVYKWLERETGVLDPDIYNYELVYGIPFNQDKAGRLEYRHSSMSHAMVLTGVDLADDGSPIKWRVENSWGSKFGENGYLLMSDRWFDEFLYEVAINKRYLSSDLLEMLETAPIVLPPWDPMGALARAE